jgi:hypothetical protein
MSRGGILTNMAMNFQIVKSKFPSSSELATMCLSVAEGGVMPPFSTCSISRGPFSEVAIVESLGKVP